MVLGQQHHIQGRGCMKKSLPPPPPLHGNTLSLQMDGWIDRQTDRQIQIDFWKEKE
jgi:hypothetical protein